jgi:putative ABC transport system substrate-binding protein
MNLAADDPVRQMRIAAFHQAVHGLGWTVDRNIRVEIRWAVGDPDRIRRFVAE